MIDLIMGGFGLKPCQKTCNFVSQLVFDEKVTDLSKHYYFAEMLENSLSFSIERCTLRHLRPVTILRSAQKSKTFTWKTPL